MKIKVIAAGSRGDIQPYVALGLGLQASGHDVCIVTHKSFSQFVKSYGLDIYPITVDPEELINSEKGKSMMESGSNPLVSIKHFIDLYKSALSEFLECLLPACQGADAIVFSMTTFPCYFVAEKLKIPSVAAYLFPFNRTKDFANIFWLLR
jgi:sterol 3beta-glucosyltransferase